MSQLNEIDSLHFPGRDAL